MEEWYGILAIELCKSVKSWDISRGSLSTYYYMRADSVIWKEHVKRHTQKRVANEYAGELNLDIVSEPICNMEERLLLDDMKSYGNDDIVELRYQGYSQYEIAEKLGINQGTVSRILSDILEKYKKNSGDEDYK